MYTLKHENLIGMINTKLIRNFIIVIITGVICGVISDITGKNTVIAVWFVFIIARTIYTIGETKILVDILKNFTTEDEP